MPDSNEFLAQKAHSSPDAFATLYERHISRIYSYITRRINDVHVAEDLTAIVFQNAFKDLRRRQWSGEYFTAWLYQIARNEVAGWHRRNKLRLFLRIDAALVDSKYTPEELLQDQDNSRLLRDCLTRLAPKDKELLELRFIEGLSVAEVSQLLGIRSNLVHQRTHRALERLRQQLMLVKSDRG